jgi:hypothetical protein
MVATARPGVVWARKLTSAPGTAERVRRVSVSCETITLA